MTHGIELRYTMGMGLRYCKACRRADPEQKTVAFQGLFYCVKCRQPTVAMETERVAFSKELRAELAALSVQGISQESESAEAQLTGQVKHYYKKAPEPILLQCEDVLRHDPNNSDAHFTLARLYFSQGNSALFSKHFEELLRIDPEHEGAKVFLGTQEQLQQLEQDAKAQAVTKDIERLEQRIQYLMEEEEWALILQCLDDILRLDPSQISASQRRAEALMRLERYDDAVAALLALKHDSDDSHIDYNLGVAHFLAGNHDEAKGYFEQVLESGDEELRHLSSDYLSSL